jgi:phage gp36-like protein
MPVYATLTDLTALGLRSAALAGISAADQQRALEAASRVADSYLQARYTLPLSAWGIDLTRTVAIIAAYDLLAARGFASEGADEHVRLRYEDAIRWLRDVSLGVVTPVDIVDASPTAPNEGIRAVTDPRRW